MLRLVHDEGKRKSVSKAIFANGSAINAFIRLIVFIVHGGRLRAQT
jgi:hypothetical protein